MNKWTININNKGSFVLEVADITFLKNDHPLWFLINREIDGFFNNKQCESDLRINNSTINKNDWECIFIPFDSRFSLEKVTTKSPLKKWQDDAINYLELSPSYAQLLESWEILKEEVILYNTSNNIYRDFPIQLRLQDFNSQVLINQLIFKSVQQMSPFKYKLTLLKLLVNGNPKKKRLIILEFPELFCTNNEKRELYELIDLLKNRGNQIIIVTSSNDLKGAKNYIHNNLIINEMTISEEFFYVKNELPLLLEKEDFLLVKDQLLSYVDKDIKSGFNVDSERRYPQLISIAFILCKKFNIPINVDLIRCEDNIRNYLTFNGYENKLSV